VKRKRKNRTEGGCPRLCFPRPGRNNTAYVYFRIKIDGRAVVVTNNGHGTQGEHGPFHGKVAGPEQKDHTSALLQGRSKPSWESLEGDQKSHDEEPQVLKGEGRTPK